MSDLISREALKRFLIDDFSFYPAIVAQALKRAPSVDAVEVKHGQWQEWAGSLVKCTACGHEYIDHLEAMNYCGNCGAKMDGKENE